MAPLAAPAASARAAITRASSPPAVPSQAASVASTAAAPRTLTLAQLGPEQRRDLPTLAVGGAVWSESAANRFVLINGQVVREGDSAAPGVTLERIGPKAVWLRWRDLRLEVPL
jgi:general secretion pathway protein B